MGRRQQWVYRIEPEEFPRDFPERLDRFRQASGLSWGGLARALRVNARTVRRWKAGSKVGSGHLVKLLELAAALGLLHHLLLGMGDRYVLAEGGRRRAGDAFEECGDPAPDGHLRPVIANFGMHQNPQVSVEPPGSPRNS